MLATVGERPFVPPREASFVDSPEKMVIDSVRSSVRDSSTFTFTRPATKTTMASAKVRTGCPRCHVIFFIYQIAIQNGHKTFLTYCMANNRETGYIKI